MRIWSVSPQYLDAKGLVAAWREGLLAQKCLAGLTKGYNNHPQLNRFKAADDPMKAIGTYLHGLAQEAKNRNYNFDDTKIQTPNTKATLTVTKGQLDYEWAHLLKKLKERDPNRYQELQSKKEPTPHSLFQTIPGDIEEWEII